MYTPKKVAKVIGVFKPVIFPHFQSDLVVAKMDTGAYSGALHCTKIRAEDDGSGTVLKFSPFGRPENEVVMTDFAVKYVRSSNGDEQRRYFINTEIIIDDITYPIVLSLADRSDMKWQVLIGRRFLRAHNFVVDASQPRGYGTGARNKK